jgi:hypothetical protein
MPLYKERLVEALRNKASAFHRTDKTIQADLNRLQGALQSFEGMSQQDIDNVIANMWRPGARPTFEQDSEPLILPFPVDWSNHQHARGWASSVLSGVTTCAVDGSQISPSKDLSIPVGLVQIGWFENPHDPLQQYTKDVYVEVLSAEELSSNETSFGEQEVEWRRFKGETEHIISFMERNAGSPAVVFFDGSLIISFVGLMAPERQQAYVELTETLLAKSEATRVPVIGYVDTSFASDLSALIALLYGYTGTRVSDATLLRDRMKWGERSRLYICSRHDTLSNSAFYEKVCFTYLKTTRENPPARVELPLWTLDTEYYQWVLDIVRAECIVGIGYPYPIETADSVAVLSSQDRESFYQIFQQFAERQTLPLRFSRKSTSKRRRRL